MNVSKFLHILEECSLYIKLFITIFQGVKRAHGLGDQATTNTSILLASGLVVTYKHNAVTSYRAPEASYMLLLVGKLPHDVLFGSGEPLRKC